MLAAEEVMMQCPLDPIRLNIPRVHSESPFNPQSWRHLVAGAEGETRLSTRSRYRRKTMPTTMTKTKTTIATATTTATTKTGRTDETQAEADVSPGSKGRPTTQS